MVYLSDTHAPNALSWNSDVGVLFRSASVKFDLELVGQEIVCRRCCLRVGVTWWVDVIILKKGLFGKCSGSDEVFAG